MAAYVLDTSAIMAILLDEEGADTAKDVIYSREIVYLPFITRMEVEYKFLQENPGRTAEALGIMEEWPVALVESFYRWSRAAAKVKALSSISVAGSWVAACAIVQNAELVHKDPEFDAVPDLKHLRLPYKSRTRSS